MILNWAFYERRGWLVYTPVSAGSLEFDAVSGEWLSENFRCVLSLFT